MKKKKSLPVIGWREWVTLSDFDIPWIKAKVDTGARSSSLHAFNPLPFRRRGEDWIRFHVHPVQRKSLRTVEVEARILEYRNVKSSSGKASLRPVILTNVKMLEKTWPIELTLASRDEMGFRMLLGREAVRGRFLVNPGSSYYAGKPPRKKKNKSVVK